MNSKFIWIAFFLLGIFLFCLELWAKGYAGRCLDFHRVLDIPVENVFMLNSRLARYLTIISTCKYTLKCLNLPSIGVLVIQGYRKKLPKATKVMVHPSLHCYFNFYSFMKIYFWHHFTVLPEFWRNFKIRK